MEFTFKLDESATSLVLAALSKLPYEQSAVLIHGLREEARKQLAAKHEAEAAAAADLPTHATADTE